MKDVGMDYKETVEGDYTFIDFCEGKLSRRENKIAVRTGNGKDYVAFQGKMARSLAEFGKCFVRVRVDNLTGDAFLVFCFDQGTPVLGYDNKVKKSFRVNNRAMARWFRSRYGLEDGVAHLQCSKNLANSPNYLTYKILR